MSTVPRNLPNNTPSEVLDISPEALEIANCYLQNQNAADVSVLLSVPVVFVTQTLARKDVRAYIDQVFFDIGFNNRFKMRAAMDAIIKKKFQDLEEAQTGSSKDILDIMALSHKITMEQMNKQLEIDKIHASTIKSQVNVQINETGLSDGTKYGKLIHELLSINEKNPE